MAPSTLLRQTFSPLATVANAPSQQAKSRPPDLMLALRYHSLDGLPRNSQESKGRASLGFTNCSDFRNVHLHRAKTSQPLVALCQGSQATASGSASSAGVELSVDGVLAEWMGLSGSA